MAGTDCRPSIILVADDEPGVLRLMVTILETLGHEVLPAANGEEALRVFESRGGDIDLLLTDIRMDPHMNGDVLAREVLGRRPATPVLYVSGHTPSHDTVARDVQERRALFLPKPFTPSVLRQKVEEALSLAQA